MSTKPSVRRVYWKMQELRGQLPVETVYSLDYLRGMQEQKHSLVIDMTSMSFVEERTCPYLKGFFYFGEEIIDVLRMTWYTRKDLPTDVLQTMSERYDPLTLKDIHFISIICGFWLVAAAIALVAELAFVYVILPLLQKDPSRKGRRIDKRKMDTLRAKLRQIQQRNKRLQRRLQRQRQMRTVAEVFESIRVHVSPAVAALVEAQLRMRDDLLFQCYSVLVDVGLEPVAVKNHLKCCQICSKEFPPDSEINGNHQCTPYCKNCDEDHSPLDPICPARVYADEQHNQETGPNQPPRHRPQRRPGQAQKTTYPEADPHAGGQTSKNQQTPQGPGQEPESAEDE
ncbi:hypothetical protein HPB47_016229 [Ixodes persulcatus]|uniref:Uncharacterized protein n=1 Tax=Ixodes persulcatus TaxID=34615 RepID=A0AC60QRF9_IXOPE|nr:hypothetical protein HPB47_016229 [Ixodes persulcatus]